MGLTGPFYPSSNQGFSIGNSEVNWEEYIIVHALLSSVMLPDGTKFLWLVLISTSSLLACFGSNNDVQCSMSLQELLNDHPQGQSQPGMEFWASGRAYVFASRQHGTPWPASQGLQFCNSLTGRFRLLSFTVKQGLFGALLRDCEKKQGGLGLHKINDDIAIVALYFL